MVTKKALNKAISKTKNCLLYPKGQNKKRHKKVTIISQRQGVERVNRSAPYIWEVHVVEHFVLLVPPINQPPTRWWSSVPFSVENNSRNSGKFYKVWNQWSVYKGLTSYKYSYSGRMTQMWQLSKMRKRGKWKQKKLPKIIEHDYDIAEQVQMA